MRLSIRRSRAGGVAGCAIAFSFLFSVLFICNSALGQAGSNTVPLTLREAIDHALINNRALQIQRIEPRIARARVQSSYGAWDPIITADVKKQSDSDQGGLDPLNFNADSAYSADSETANLGVIGVLPTGLKYTIGGRYAHSQGNRNFLNFQSYRVSSGITVDQPLLRDFWIDQPRYTIKLNKGLLKITELGVEYVAMDIINQIQQAYHDLVFAWEYLEVQRSLLQTRTNFLRNIQRQVELGYLTILEDRVAQANAASISAELVRASNGIAIASNLLKNLMGLTQTNWFQEYYQPAQITLMMPEEFNLPVSWTVGLKQRPDLRQLGMNLKNAELLMKYRKNQLFPYLGLIGSYNLTGSDSLQAFPPDTPQASQTAAFQQWQDRVSPSTMIGILFSMPLTRTVERGEYRESKELKAQAELLLKQKEELVMREIADALETARLNWDRAESARTATAAADLALQAEEQRLAGGTGNVIFVLQAQDFIVSNRIKELESKRDYNKALSQLYFTEGTLLEKTHIEFDFK